MATIEHSWHAELELRNELLEIGDASMEREVLWEKDALLAGIALCRSTRKGM